MSKENMLPDKWKEIQIEPWSEDTIENIKEEISCLMIDGLHSGKLDIFDNIKRNYPPSKDCSYRKVYRVFSKVYYDVQKEIIDAAEVEKSLIIPKQIERLEWLYNKAIADKRYRDAKSIVDSLVKIVGADKIQQMLQEDKNGELCFHLDFGL